MHRSGGVCHASVGKREFGINLLNILLNIKTATSVRAVRRVELSASFYAKISVSSSRKLLIFIIYCKKNLDRSIRKNSLFNFENRSTGRAGTRCALNTKPVPCLWAVTATASSQNSTRQRNSPEISTLTSLSAGIASVLSFKQCVSELLFFKITWSIFWILWSGKHFLR